MPNATTSKAQRTREYVQKKREFLNAQPYCEVCPRILPLKRRHYANDIHHVRGRLGPLLTDTEFWLATCREGHDWIHANIAKARECGLIAKLGEWNRTPRTSAREGNI